VKSRDEDGMKEDGGPSAGTQGVPDDSRAREAFAKSAESLEGKDGKKATYMWSGQEINPPRVRCLPCRSGCRLARG
jgi:hypothetical protein